MISGDSIDEALATIWHYKLAFWRQKFQDNDFTRWFILYLLCLVYFTFSWYWKMFWIVMMLLFVRIHDWIRIDKVFTVWFWRMKNKTSLREMNKGFSSANESKIYNYMISLQPVAFTNCGSHRPATPWGRLLSGAQQPSGWLSQAAGGCPRGSRVPSSGVAARSLTGLGCPSRMPVWVRTPQFEFLEYNSPKELNRMSKCVEYTAYFPTN